MLIKKKRIPINEEIDKLKIKISKNPAGINVEDIVKLNRLMREMSLEHYKLYTENNMRETCKKYDSKT